MRNSKYLIKGFGTAAIALSLVACDGSSTEDYGASGLTDVTNGGGSSNGGGTSGNSSLIVADTKSISATSLRDVNVAATVNFTVDTTDTLYVQVSDSAYSGLESAIAEVNGTGSAELNLVYKTSEDLSPGAYQDSVVVKFCSDENCDTEIQGSPVTITSSLTVDMIDSTGSEPLILKENRTEYITDMFAATYVKNAGVFVAAVNSNPDELDFPPMTVIFIDPVTKVKGLVGYLSYPATSIMSDNTGTTPRVVVGHANGWVTVFDYNKTTPAASLNYLLNTGYPLGKIALNGTDVYAIPAAGGPDAIRRIDLSTNEYAEYAGVEVPAGSSLSAHADGESVYVASAGTGGVLQHLDVTGGTVSLTGDSSASGLSDFCNGLWSSASNDKLISGCGDVYTSSKDPAADMLHLGNIAQPEVTGLKNPQEVIWFADSVANANEMMTISHKENGCTPFVDCQRTLTIYDKRNYTHKTSRTFGSYLAADDEPVRFELPIAAAYNEDGDEIYVLTRLEIPPLIDNGLGEFVSAIDVEAAYLHIIKR